MMAVLIKIKMTKYLANDSPTPLSANLSEKQKSKYCYIVFMQKASQKVKLNGSKIKRFCPLP